jgi:EAL domain-containing protein (putative c-di-GMP-specific phosphodiesterase class I)
MALVEIIIQIAKIMHLEVIAEGVESKSDLEVLQYLKCNYYQGYYFSKPVPIALFNSLVLQQR